MSVYVIILQPSSLAWGSPGFYQIIFLTGLSALREKPMWSVSRSKCSKRRESFLAVGLVLWDHYWLCDLSITEQVFLAFDLFILQTNGTPELSGGGFPANYPQLFQAFFILPLSPNPSLCQGLSPNFFLNPPIHGSVNPFSKTLFLIPAPLLKNNHSLIQAPVLLYCLPSSLSALGTFLWLHVGRKDPTSYWRTFWGVLSLSFTFNLTCIWNSLWISLG